MKKLFEHPALEEPIMVDYAFDVCGSCKGHGVHTRNDLDQSRLVELMIEDGDEDGIEAYRRGAYDMVCETCHGQRVVLVPDLPEHIQCILEEWYDEERASRMYAEQERRAGA